MQSCSAGACQVSRTACSSAWHICLACSFFLVSELGCAERDAAGHLQVVEIRAESIIVKFGNRQCCVGSMTHECECLLTPVVALQLRAGCLCCFNWQACFTLSHRMPTRSDGCSQCCVAYVYGQALLRSFDYVIGIINTVRLCRCVAEATVPVQYPRKRKKLKV